MIFKRLLLFFGLTLFIGINLVYAHPLDISISVFDIDSQTDKISVSTYLHPFEVGYLLEKQENVKITDFNEIFQYKEVFFNYIQDSVLIKNNGDECEFVSANVPPKNEFEIMGEGLEVEYEMQCKNPLGIIDFKNKLFVDGFELQTNKMLFHKDGDFRESLFEKILTAKVTSDSFDFYNPGKNLNPDKDDDNDGLTNHEENLYFTDLNNPDTDFDGYSDKEEVDSGWDARNPIASPGQVQMVSPEEAKNKKLDAMLAESQTRIPVSKEEIKTEEVVTRKSQENDNNDLAVNLKQKNNAKYQIPVTSIHIPDKEGKPQASKFFGTKHLKYYLQKIQIALESGSFWAKFLVLFFAYILGFLHSLESGHGKSILISYLADYKKGLKDAFQFAGFMTFTHLIDVVVLGVVFKVFAMTNDIFGIIFIVQKWGVYILLTVSVLLMIKSIFNIEIPKFFKNGKALGIASGLAPCTIGWALMIAMLSIGQINWLVPVIVIFGLGIFSSLMLMSIIIVKLKTKLIKSSGKLARISSFVSAVLLFVSALVLMIEL